MVGPSNLENSEPNLEINPRAIKPHIELLEKIRSGLKANPELYAAMLDMWIDHPNDGAGQILAYNEYLTDRPADSDQAPEVKDLWKDLLRSLSGEFSIENDYWFDPSTQEEIKNYEPIKKLIEKIDHEDTLYTEKRVLKDRVKALKWRVFLGRVLAEQTVEVETLEVTDEASGSAA